MQGISRWSLILGAAALAGCASGSEPTVAPASPSLSNAGGPVVQSARGAGHFTIAGELRTFSFTAIRYADGTVEGEYQLFNRARDTRIHGDVECLSVVGNLAWIGGRQEQGSDPLFFPPGLENGFRVADNGEGANDPPDDISEMLVNLAPGSAQAYCNARPAAPPLIAIESGNIQVRD